MKRLFIGLIVGLFIGGVPVSAKAPKPDPHHCAALVNLTLRQYDRAFKAMEDLNEYDPPRVTSASIRLGRVNDTWTTFWGYAQDCSPQH